MLLPVDFLVSWITRTLGTDSSWDLFTSATLFGFVLCFRAPDHFVLSSLRDLNSFSSCFSNMISSLDFTQSAFKKQCYNLYFMVRICFSTFTSLIDFRRSFTCSWEMSLFWTEWIACSSSSKGELLIGSVELVKLIHGHWHCVSS